MLLKKTKIFINNNNEASHVLSEADIYFFRSYENPLLNFSFDPIKKHSYFYKYLENHHVFRTHYSSVHRSRDTVRLPNGDSVSKQEIAKQDCYSGVAGMVEHTEKFNNLGHLENIDSEFSYAQ